MLLASEEVRRLMEQEVLSRRSIGKMVVEDDWVSDEDPTIRQFHLVGGLTPTDRHFVEYFVWIIASCFLFHSL